MALSGLELKKYIQKFRNIDFTGQIVHDIKTCID